MAKYFVAVGDWETKVGRSVLICRLVKNIRNYVSNFITFFFRCYAAPVGRHITKMAYETGIRGRAN